MHASKILFLARTGLRPYDRHIAGLPIRAPLPEAGAEEGERSMEPTLETLVQRVARLEQELTAAQSEARRADDYRQVVNCMMRHIYGYYYHQEEEELKKYWAIDRPDVMYAHGNVAHYGYKSIYQYYVLGTNRSKAHAREVGKAVYGIDYTGNAAPGYRVVHILGSPYVEIAGDGETAQGVWMALSTMSRMEDDGRADPQQVIQRFSADFVCEGGVWKIWHVRDYEDFIFKPLPLMPALDGRARPDDPEPEYGPYADDAARRAAGIVKLELDSAMLYQPWTVTAHEPHLPEPYETWADTTPNIRVIPE